MANNVGRLVVELAASTAKFQSDLGKAAREAEIASKRISSAFRAAQNIAAGIGAGLSVHAFAGMIQGSIDAADHLNDLSQRTGVAVETLSGLGLAAKQSGTDLDSVGKAFGKLNIHTAEATAGNIEAARAFKGVGLSVADLKKLSPEEIFARVADRFADWTDGANKARIGNALFGKSYQDIIPLLNQGGDSLRQSAEYAKKYGGVTTEVAKQADEFNDTVEKLKFQAGAFSRTLAAELLPSLQALSNQLLELQESGDGFKSFAQDAASIIRGVGVAAVYTTTFVANLGRSVGALAAAANAGAHLQFAQAGKIMDLLHADNERSTKEAKALIDAINNPTANVEDKRKQRTKKNAPDIGSPDADATAKSILDGQLKALERSIKDEETALNDRNTFLQAYFQDGYISIREFYQRRQQVIGDALTAEVAAYDKEIAALQAFAAKANPKDRVEAENKIAEAVDKRAEAQKKAAVAGVTAYLDEARALKEFRDGIEELALQVQEQQGGPQTDVTLARFDKQYEARKKAYDLMLESYNEEDRRLANVGLTKLGQLREEIKLRSQIKDLQTGFDLGTRELDVKQGSIDLQFQTGSITELDAINSKAAAAKAYADALRPVVDAWEEIARKSGDPQLIVQVEEYRLALQRLEAQADELRKKFQDIFTGSFSDALASIVDGTKSVKDAFKDMAKSIEQQITKIAAQNVAESLFKKGGALGGVSDFFAKMFGGGNNQGDNGPSDAVGGFLGKLFGGGKASDATGAAALATAGATLTASGTTLSTAGITLTTAAATLQAAAASLAASSAASGAGSLFSGFGFGGPFGGAGSGGFGLGGFGGLDGLPLFANGTNFAPGGLAIVGERGPELVNLPRGSQVLPNNVIKGNFGGKSTVVHQTVNVSVAGAMNSKTADQLAVEIGRRTQRALARNA